MGYWGDGVDWWTGLTWLLLTLAFWALVVWGLAAMIGHWRRHPPGPWGGSADGGWGAPPLEEPERLLARRFANGEIDEEEFLARLDTLRRRRPGGERPERGSGGISWRGGVDVPLQGWHPPHDDERRGRADEQEF